MSRGVFLVGLLFVVLLKEGYGAYPERILLQDIQVITLNQGKYTNARRSAPILQLKCTGGTAGCSAYVPQVVQCYNRGSDGYDVQWECKTEMEKAYRFGQLEVSCEGYDYPDDPYVLKGSCGLEYKLDLTGVGNHQHGYRTEESYYSKPHRHGGSSVGTIVLIGLACLVIFFLYKWLSAPQQQQWTTGGRGPSTFGSSASPPPPGFRPEYMPGSGSSGGGCSYPDPNSPPNNSGLGGFWTGATTGGILGYLFGSRNNAGYHRQPNYSGFGSSGWGNSGSGSGWGASASRGSSASSSGSDTRTTSGFGGTKRR